MQPESRLQSHRTPPGGTPVTKANDLPDQQTVLTYSVRERARTLVRNGFPKRRWKVVIAREPGEFSSAMRTTLVDAAVVDIAGASSNPEVWTVAALARDFPASPFFALTQLRSADAPTVARCASLDFCDVVVEDVDPAVLSDIVSPFTFSTRFTAALASPPENLALRTPIQIAAWRAIVSTAGRRVRTSALASELGISREHLSRSFSTSGAPNLKRLIDLVRLIAAAELAKSSGLDIRDISRILGFASSSHLAVTAQRVLGTRPASLARLRTVDLLERFTQGRTRSRG